MANIPFIESESIPTLSLSSVPASRRKPYIQHLMAMPSEVFAALNNPAVGPFTRGLVKAHGLPVERSAAVAFIILRVAINEVPADQMTTVIVESVGLPAEKAQRMVAEIQEDIFGPVQQELQNYWNAQQRRSGDDPSSREAFFYTGASTFPKGAPSANSADSNDKESGGPLSRLTRRRKPPKQGD